MDRIQHGIATGYVAKEKSVEKFIFNEAKPGIEAGLITIFQYLQARLLAVEMWSEYV